MNNVTSGAIGFAVGGAIGAGTAWYLTRQYWVKSINEIVNKIVEARLEELGIDSTQVDDDEAEDSKDESDDDSDDPLRTVSSLSKEYVGDQNNEIDYQKFYNKKDPEQMFAEEEHPHDSGELPENVTPEEAAEIEGEELSDEHAGDVKLDRKPYPITPDQYVEEHPEYEKETVYAYSDGVMALENDEMLDDVPTVLGDVDIQPRYGNDTVYIRNDRFSTDYEVIYVETTYEQVVDGPVDWAD